MDALPVDGLPPGWVEASLDTICEINPATDVSGLPSDAPVTFVPMAAVGTLTNTIDTSKTRPLREITTGFTRFRSGDVIFAKITPCMENGKIALVPELPHGIGIGSTEFHVLRPKPGVDAGYVCHFVMREAFRAAARRSMSGAVGQQRVPAGYLREATIPVAPTAEQARVVAAVDAAFEKVGAGEAAILRTREALTQFRASLLHAACTGALTAGWRAANRTNEADDNFLMLLMAARRELNGRRNRAVLPPDTSDGPPLPSGWCWASVDQITDFVGNGLARAPDGDVTDRRILRISAVRPLKVDRGEHRFYRPLPEESLAGATMQRHDLLFTRYSGSEQYVGVCGLVRFEDPMLFPDKVMCARPLSGFSDVAEYLEIALNAGPSRAYIARNIRTTAGQKGVAGSSIRACPVPLPPRREMAAIVAAVREAESGTTGLPSGDVAAQLRQSILHAAFTGRLVPQDPVDEPAATLLTRLRATPATARSSRRRRTAAQPNLIETPA